MRFTYRELLRKYGIDNLEKEINDYIDTLFDLIEVKK